MALKNVPFRSEVLAWNPDNLADYFRKVSLSLLCFWLGWYAFSWVGRDWRWNPDRMWKAYGIVVDTRRQTDIAFLVMCPEEKDEGGGPSAAQVPSIYHLCIQCSTDRVLPDTTHCHRSSVLPY